VEVFVNDAQSEPEGILVLLLCIVEALVGVVVELQIRYLGNQAKVAGLYQ